VQIIIWLQLLPAMNGDSGDPAEQKRIIIGRARERYCVGRCGDNEKSLPLCLPAAAKGLCVYF
jgi:hypothetical protein